MEDRLSLKIEKIERSIDNVSKKLDKLRKNLKFILWVIVVVVIFKFIIVWEQEVTCTWKSLIEFYNVVAYLYLNLN